MKKLFTLYMVLTVIAAIALSSCSSNRSITKRRYTKGYYVSHGTNRHSSPKANEHKETTVAKAETPLMVAPKPAETIVSTNDKKPEVVSAEAVTTANDVKTGNNTSNTAVNSHQSTPAHSPANLSVQKPFKAVSAAASNKKFVAGDSDGLSLFWIVILVLLILWALGLIGGFGGFVYLLLVVALILLILWLLRIV